ncbi:hypothetical protein CAPTEDRAFT_218459 [Capitella teleta]|uniref:VWFD domain-containing protein n=1 Tax=Capitella teleta TaxID=283909 RepID=R7VIS7_CAPTE|nr:hypothetical protein CAPTEDRAFT_218459 [Capitella teleta]|eukprot:ELU18733.1 hypothetical protein CAPTEDRAFT_218459 [Capitella teleta]
MQKGFFVLLVLPVALRALRLWIAEVDPIRDRVQIEEQESERVDILQSPGDASYERKPQGRYRRSIIGLFYLDSSQLTQGTRGSYKRVKRVAGCLIKGKKYEIGEKWKVNRGVKSYVCTCPKNFSNTKRVKCKRQKPACQVGGEFIEEGHAKNITVTGVVFICSCNSSKAKCLQEDQSCKTADGATYGIGEYFDVRMDGFLQNCVCRTGNNSSSNAPKLPYSECQQLNEETSTVAYAGHEEKTEVNGVCKLPDGRHVTRGLHAVVVNYIHYDCMCTAAYVKCEKYNAESDYGYAGNGTKNGNVTVKPNGGKEITCLLPDHRSIRLGVNIVIVYGDRTYECICEDTFDRKASCKYVHIVGNDTAHYVLKVQVNLNSGTWSKLIIGDDNGTERVILIFVII